MAKKRTSQKPGKTEAPSFGHGTEPQTPPAKPIAEMDAAEVAAQLRLPGSRKNQELMNRAADLLAPADDSE